MPEPPPAMTVTIEVADGPTVRLTYNGGWARESIVPYTSVAVRDQPVTPAPRWLYRLLSRASALLMLYAADIAGRGGPQTMTDDENVPAPHMRPELAALVDWLRSSGRMAHVHYGRLLHEVVAIGQRATFKASGHGDVDTLTSAGRTVQTHLRATVVDHDPAALALLLEGLIPLARFVGDNPIRLLVATGVLTDEEVDDRVDAWVEEAARRNPPPTGLTAVSSASR